MKSESSGSENRPVPAPAKQHLNNWEVAVYALYLKGGATTPVRTEDVALKCFELSPDSFSWIHHPQYPDKDIARVALTDARKPKVGTLVRGRSGTGYGRGAGAHARAGVDGWTLTQEGVGWVVDNEARLAVQLREKDPRFHRQEVLQRIKRIRESTVFKAFLSGPARFEPTLGELADLMRCRVDAGESVWTKRLDILRNQAQLVRQQDVLEFVAACESKINDLIHS